METKHTPGPWEVETYLPEAYRIRPKGKPKYCTESSEEFFANARLIAAAPDLLALVRSYATTYPLDEYHDKATAAIAKATGDK